MDGEGRADLQETKDEKGSSCKAKAVSKEVEVEEEPSLMLGHLSSQEYPCTGVDYL